MKLRQACCNPRLIDPNSTIESSKLQVFRLGRRRTAGQSAQGPGLQPVYRPSQYHPRISRRSRGSATSISTAAPAAKQRKIRVDAFQAGQGDLFLISLKAGGLGLNLTAADYVIHMDPWWNPAIEDQASDRAHRIGQTRPVTIYRLVCKNTIEEKIVKLHQEKRDLAGSLLEGSDISAKMTSEDLLDLIKDK